MKMKKIMQPYPDFYEIIRSVLEKHENPNTIKSKIKEELREEPHPDWTYQYAARVYLNKAIKRADYPKAKNAFWNIFFDDIKNHSEGNFYIPYYALQLEGLYDMVQLDEDKSFAVGPSEWRGIGGPSLSSLSFSWLRDIIDHVENKGKPVLIIGDTGTSKDAMATVIHKLSKRRGESPVTINCAAIPENLIESELFGVIPNYPGFHDKKGKEGMIEEANKGTLFLDEIGKTTLDFQGKLLRFIQEKTFRKLGGTKDMKVEVRIIAAIHKKVVDDENKFLPDLKYRLGYPYCINMPTLNERLDQFKGDASHRIITNSLNVVLDRLEMRDKILQYKISADAFKLLRVYNYTGNYRELENILMSAVYSAKRNGRDIIRKEDLGLLKTIDRNAEGEKRVSENKLKDIFSYADKVKGYIIETKIQEVLESGRDIRNVLNNEYAQEGQTLTDSQYIQFTRDIEKVTGKKISAFKKMKKNQG